MYGADPHNPNARSELIRRAEKASVNMAEVREVRFMGVNITKDGMQPITMKQPKASSSIDNIDLKIEDVSEDLKPQVNSQKDSISETTPLPEEQKQDKIMTKKKKGKKASTAS